MSTHLYDDLASEAETRATERSVARAVDGGGERCPECENNMLPAGGGWVCRSCGYSPAGSTECVGFIAGAEAVEVVAKQGAEGAEDG